MRRKKGAALFGPLPLPKGGREIGNKSASFLSSAVASASSNVANKRGEEEEAKKKTLPLFSACTEKWSLSGVIFSTTWSEKQASLNLPCFKCKFRIQHHHHLGD